MAKPKIRTIRASTHPLGTGDFTTIQAWEDYVDDKINPFQWAECYQGFDLGTFTLSGWSSTPTSSSPIRNSPLVLGFVSIFPQGWENR